MAHHGSRLMRMDHVHAAGMLDAGDWVTVRHESPSESSHHTPPVLHLKSAVNARRRQSGSEDSR